MYYDWFNQNIEVYEIQNLQNEFGETIPSLNKIDEGKGLLTSIKRQIIRDEGGFLISDIYILFTETNVDLDKIFKIDDKYYKIKSKMVIKDYFGQEICFEYEVEEWKL